MEEANVAVPLVGAALADKRHLSTRCLAKLRLVVRGQNFHFLDGIRIEGYVGATVVAGVHVGSAINGELVLVGARAVHVELVDTACP